jgi:predicted RNA polymerase sigma factor
VNALLSLMCFHASRFDARFGADGELILYDDQDTGLWDTDLISRGSYFLSNAATGDKLSKYHIEASIAYWNTKKEDTAEKWENVLQLYNQLLVIEYSPVAAINRTYALAKARNKEQAIAEAEQLKLENYPFYYALLGELYTGVDNNSAKENFNKALALAKNPADRQAIQKKIDKL